MEIQRYKDFAKVNAVLEERMINLGHTVHPQKWQGFDVSSRPEAEMVELTDVSFKVPLRTRDLRVFQGDLSPNLPWADDHFEERVGGQPTNPGVTWTQWPWSNSADKSRMFGINGEKFSHSYMERYWPKHCPDKSDTLMEGLRFDYGDLNDVVALLAREPSTRQAYLPVFFPEDTGVTHGNRVPCTLGYHFYQRFGYLHVYYPIRSCDLHRHFRDDMYLTTRLLLWVLSELEKVESSWKEVKPGYLSTWIGSLHMFVNDYRLLLSREGCEP